MNFKDMIQRFPRGLWLVGAFLCVILVMGSSSKTDKPSRPSAYFDKEPYLNPKLIQDMTTWLSDTGDQVIGIDLQGSQDSNRYFCEKKVRKIPGQTPFVYYADDDESFGYSFVGKTGSGIHILKTASSGGGSGVFHELVFVVLEMDRQLSYDKTQMVLDCTRRRFILKKLGSIPLGDRFDGSVEIKGDRLYIRSGQRGRDEGHVKEQVIVINEGQR